MPQNITALELKCFVSICHNEYQYKMSIQGSLYKIGFSQNTFVIESFARYINISVDFLYCCLFSWATLLNVFYFQRTSFIHALRDIFQTTFCCDKDFLRVMSNRQKKSDVVRERESGEFCRPRNESYRFIRTA